MSLLDEDILEKCDDYLPIDIEYIESLGFKNMDHYGYAKNTWAKRPDVDYICLLNFTKVDGGWEGWIVRESRKFIRIRKELLEIIENPMITYVKKRVPYYDIVVHP